MTTRISTATLALGIVSGGATAGPLADLLNGITGATGQNSLTGGIATSLNTLTGGFNDSPLSALTTLPTIDPDGGSILGIGAFESDATGNGQLLGIGAGNDNQNAASGTGGLVGLGALQSGNSGNSDTIGVGLLTGDNSGNGGLIGLSALSDGGNSGQGGLLGVELLNGDAVLGLNSGLAGQSADIIPNPAGVSGTALTDALGAPLRDGLQDALQQGGAISGPLEELVVTLDNALVEPLGDALSPVTEPLSALAGVGIDGSDGSNTNNPLSLLNAVVTGDSSGGNGSDINAGVISQGDGQGEGAVLGAGAFSGDNAGGGVISVGAISGANGGQGGDINVAAANNGENSATTNGSTRDGGGILTLGVANTPAATTPITPPPRQPPPNVNFSTTSKENCTTGGESNDTGLKGAGQATQFNSRSANEDDCTDPSEQQLGQAS